jgi:RNA polymerase sigma-70 factor (ECF subfamily)
LINRLVGNVSAADDIVHQAFVKLIAIDEDKALDNSPAYLTRAARNLALNHIRDLRRRSEVGLPDTTLHALPDASPTPEAAAIARCELRLVLRAVAALPPRRREAFVLSRFEGLSYDEIAARQGVSRNTVISQIVMALADLNRQIGPQ